MTMSVVLGAGAFGALMTLCPPGELPDPGETFRVQSEMSWAIMARDLEPDASPDGGAVAGVDPGVVGQWTPPIPWDVIAIHAAVLPSGHVIHYSYPWGTDGSRARVWDPVSTKFQTVDWSEDIFCSGLSHLPDGRLLVTGGNDSECQFQGRYDVSIFDWTTGQWTFQQDMVDGRWYPTNINLADGSTLIFSGLTRFCENNPVVEMFTPDDGVSVVPTGHRFMSLYPRMHLLTDGRVAHVAPENAAYTFHPNVGWQFIDWNNQGWRSESTSVLLPGRTDEIMVMGGYIAENVVTNTVEIIDFKQPAPQFAYTGSLNHGRAHADAVILPDKTVMLVGGGRIGLYDDPVLIPERYDPDTGAWTQLAPHFWGRMYHATSVLIPDGRVVVAGQDSGNGNLTAEIYSPPYLFQDGTRPEILTAPTALQYGQIFPILVDDTSDIESVVMIKLSTNTHSVNFEQRLVDIVHSLEDPNLIGALAPATPGEAPPGYYMLFVIDSQGVPGVAKIVKLQPNAPADLNGDGLVGIQDMLELLGFWGPCNACIADLNADGNVDVIDLLILLASWSG